MHRPRFLLTFLALLALGAPVDAQGRSGKPPEGRGMLRLDVIDGVVDYLVGSLAGPPGLIPTEQTAGVRVRANVPYAVVVSFPTWQPGPPAPADYRQPAFSNGRYRIGGMLYLESEGARGWGPPEWAGRPGGPDWPEDGPGRGPPWRGETDDRVYQTSQGFLAAEGTRRTSEWRIGAYLGPLFTDTPGGLPAPGTYSLGVQITLQPR